MESKRALFLIILLFMAINFSIVLRANCRQTLKIGILADIHEHVDNLRRALKLFADNDIEKIIFVGDIFEDGTHIEETVDVLTTFLAEHNMEFEGVWGNHDYGLAFEPDVETTSTYSEKVVRFMTSLKPHIRKGWLHISHMETFLDPTQLEDLWYYNGPPNSPEKAKPSFDAVSDDTRLIILGHFHRHSIVTQKARVDLTDGQELALDPNEKYLFIAGAVCNGRCTILNLSKMTVLPISINQPDI